jgi:RNA polymerase sporulation-specific sigma factor
MDNLTNLILENKNMIYKITTFFTGYSNKEDLFQVGVVGLINAYKKFDPSFNTKFSTYAYPFIWGEINNYVKNDRGIKISRDISSLNSRIEKASMLLTQRLMREPSISEISHFLEIDESLVANAMISRYPTLSVDSVISDEGREITLLDTIADIDDMDINTLVALRDELSKLSVEERELINSRYVNDLTQSEVASNMGISQVQVSRKEQKVLKKLRDSLAA